MEADKWKLWRSQGLGASDAPIIMGVSPWKTRYQLWEEKCGIRVDEFNNWATQRGTDMEPHARNLYQLYNNVSMPATLFEHKDYPYLRASLDGYNAETSTILEIKCPGKDDHATAVGGKVPEKYWPQLQHQLMVTGAAICHYYSFNGTDGVTVEVKPDMGYIEKLFKELTEFWALVQTRKPPELCDKDFKKLKDPEKEAALIEWKRLDSEIKQMTSLADDLKEKIISGLSHPNVICGDVKISTVHRIGAVDYGKIPELKGVNLDLYRKKGSSYFNFNWGKK